MAPLTVILSGGNGKPSKYTKFGQKSGTVFVTYYTITEKRVEQSQTTILRYIND